MVEPSVIGKVRSGMRHAYSPPGRIGRYNPVARGLHRPTFCRRWTPRCSANKTSATGSQRSQKGPFNWLNWLNKTSQSPKTADSQQNSDSSGDRSNGVPAHSSESSSGDDMQPDKEQAASFPSAAEWTPHREAQLQDPVPEEANATGNPEYWGEGLVENEWDNSKQEAKPDPLGYIIMILMLLGAVFVTTGLFRFSGRWAASRRLPPEPRTAEVSSKDMEKSVVEKPQGSQLQEPSSVHAPHSHQELKHVQEQGDSQQEEQGAAAMRAQGRQKEADVQAVNERGGPPDLGTVFVPGSGWVRAEETSLLDGETRWDQGRPSEVTAKEGKAEEDDNQPADQRCCKPQITDEADVSRSYDAAKEPQQSQHTHDEATAQKQKGAVGMIQGDSDAGYDADSETEDPHAPRTEAQDSRHGEGQEAQSIQALQEGIFEIEPAQSDPAHSAVIPKASGRSEAQPGGHDPSGGAQQQHSLSQAAAQRAEARDTGAEELQRLVQEQGEDFWGREQRTAGPIELPKLQPVQPPSSAVDLRTVHLPQDASLTSLRARASVALRASLAATEASQRAVAYSSAATSAASRAAASAERAAAASSVAQQAACQKSEVVLEEAVLRAERAQAEADQAMKQAAEAAAYASAHQEVSGSQAAVSEQAAAAPTQEDPGLSERLPNAAKRTRQKFGSAVTAAKAGVSTAGESASSVWQGTRRTADTAGRRFADTWYASKDWASSAGHQLMAWLSVAIIWLQALWAQLVAFSVRLWGWVRTPFVRRVA